MLHFGGGSVVKSGLLDRVKKSLEKAKISYVELGGVHPNPLSDLVYKGIEIVKKENIDFILAVGGGFTIDSSKAIAMGSCYDGDFWDFYAGKANPKKALPVGTILTIAAFKSFLKSIGMPSTLAEVGGKEKDIPQLVKNFGLKEGGKTGGFVKLTSEDIAEIYRLAL